MRRAVADSDVNCAIRNNARPALAIQLRNERRGQPASVMAHSELRTDIMAPIDVVFDLARSIDAHLDSMGQSREQAIAGVASGLIGLGEQVTWKATHFGVPGSRCS